LNNKRYLQIANKYNLDPMVAMDVEYLISLQERIIEASKKHPNVRDFKVYHEKAEAVLAKLEKLDKNSQNQ
jgi:hypothetical protein